MSCLRPITINNPALIKTHVYDKRLLEVPCGHCQNCKDVRRMSWFVRLYYEWQYCIDKGGFALIETLTYNNAHLPWLLSGSCEPVKCFSVDDVQKYLKRIRKQLSSVFKHCKIEFKYFLSMEFGSRLHRPHYHIIFFVSTPVVNKWYFKYLVESKWHENGFTCSGKLNHGFVCSVGGLSYCAKYVCKDIYEDSFFRKLENKLIASGLSKEVFRPCFPHPMCSQNLGIYALEFDKYNDLDKFFNGEIYLPDSKFEVRKYKLPLYYERKIFYDIRYRFFDSRCNDYILVSKLSDVPDGVDYCPIYVLNDLGIEMKSKRSQKVLDSVTHVYRLCLSLPEYKEILDKVNEHFKKNFESIGMLQTFLSQHLPEETFVSYSLVYRGCTVVNNVNPCDCVNDNTYYDYMLIHNMSRGYRPLSVEFNCLCNNIESYMSLPLIEDCYKIIRYMYYLIMRSLDDIKLREEAFYVDLKTSYLARSEHIF